MWKRITVTREQLYAEVWAEAVMHVAKRYDAATGESAGGLRFEDDPQTRARRMSKAFEGDGRWTHAAAFDSRDIGLRGLHAPRQHYA